MFEFRLMMGEGRQRVFEWVCSIDIEMEYSLDDMAPRVNNNDTGYREADTTSDHHFIHNSGALVLLLNMNLLL